MGLAIDCIAALGLSYVFLFSVFHGLCSTLQICWMCLCTKGSDDPSWSFTNLNDGCPWMGTLFQQDPWSIKPSLADLEGFNLQMLSVDLLHAFHLGCGRDLAGSAIRSLASQAGFWAGNTQDLRLESATRSLRAFAANNRLSLTIRKLTKSNLSWETESYPELKCKGFDTFIVVKWLAHEVTLRDCGDDLLACALWAADSFLRVLHKSGTFLKEAEELHKTHVGNLFLRSYLRLASNALQARQRLWRLRPKFHLLWHVVHERRASRLNATFTSTWMDEDAMRKWMRITRMTHKRTAAINTLRRFLLGLPAKLNSAKVPGSSTEPRESWSNWLGWCVCVCGNRTCRENHMHLIFHAAVVGSP